MPAGLFFVLENSGADLANSYKTDNSSQIRLIIVDSYGVIRANLKERRKVIIAYYSDDANLIRQARIKKGYTQMKVAAIAGIEVSSYQRFEYGKCALQKSNLRLALTLCRILDIDPYAVAHLEDDEALGLYAKDYSV